MTKYKWVRMGRGLGHVCFLILFPLLSRERPKLQSSSFAGGYKVRDTKQKHKIGQKGRGLGHATYFYILGTPYYTWIG